MDLIYVFQTKNTNTELNWRTAPILQCTRRTYALHYTSICDQWRFSATATTESMESSQQWTVIVLVILLLIKFFSESMIAEN